MNLLSAIACSLAALVLVPSVVLACECLAAVFPARRSRFSLVRAARTVVLVPAHDEEACLPAALRSIEPELDEEDRVLVVAHNCTDRTAMVARALGAEVLEVRDAGTGGKPDALKAGLRHLDAEPPEVVVIIDADCRVEPGGIRALSAAAAESNGPVQSDYRFASGSGDDFGSLSSLATLVKNVVRPAGLTRLGLPCLLNGAGSAYPFRQLREAPHGEGSIAEDYQLAIDLLSRGHRTRFVPEARVRSVLPEVRGAALRQRRRWEHGHLTLVFRTAPALMLRGLIGLNRDLFFLGVDLLVPPLAFLVLGQVAAGIAALAAWSWGHTSLPLWGVVLAGILLFGSVSAALLRYAGAGALLRAARSAPAYCLQKVPLYLGFLWRRETRWRKTERGSSRPQEPADEDSRGRTGT